MKILIFFAAYKRREILKVCLQGIHRLKDYNPETYQISSLAVCSNRDEVKLCKEFGVMTIVAPNSPLGRKKNIGLRECLKYDFNYLMEIGSDDLIHESLLDYYLPHMKEGKQVFGVNKCMFYETATGKVAEWGNDFVIGAGRMFRRDVLTGMRGNATIKYKKSCSGTTVTGIARQTVTIPYLMAKGFCDLGIAEMIDEGYDEVSLWADERMRGMDSNSTTNLRMAGIGVQGVETEAWQVLDIKGGENLNGFEWFTPNGYDVLQHYQNEADAIRKLR